MIDYRAAGTLVSSVKVPWVPCSANVHIILVDAGGEWVVSRYIEGNNEWCDGHYFRRYGEAYAYFVTEVLETLPVTDIDKPGKLPDMVANLHDFLQTLKGASA